MSLAAGDLVHLSLFSLLCFWRPPKNWWQTERSNRWWIHCVAFPNFNSCCCWFQYIPHPLHGHSFPCIHLIIQFSSSSIQCPILQLLHRCRVSFHFILVSLLLSLIPRNDRWRLRHYNSLLLSYFSTRLPWISFEIVCVLQVVSSICLVFLVPQCHVIFVYYYNETKRKTSRCQRQLNDNPMIPP